MTPARIGRGAGAVALRLVPAVFIAVLFAWPLIALIRRGMRGSSVGDLPGMLQRTQAFELLGMTLGQAAASPWKIFCTEASGASLLIAACISAISADGPVMDMVQGPSARR